MCKEEKIIESCAQLSTIGENIIATIKMRNNF